MSLFDTPWQLFSALFVLAFGALVCLQLGRKFRTRALRSLTLYAWHTLFSLVYAVYALNNPSDSIKYYFQALEGTVRLSFGTGAVVTLATLFVTLLGLSFLGACLVFNIFGSIGLIAFDASLRQATRDSSRNIRLLATAIVFLPSISFWSSALGKDSIAFLAATLALWAALKIQERTWLMLLAIAIMLLPRPHIAGFMIIAFSATFIFARKTSLGQRLFFGGAALAICAILIPFALKYAGLQEGAGASEVIEYIDYRQNLNQAGGSSLDISGMSPPMQLFTYLFRPLPFEAHSIFALASSLDNLVLLLLFVFGAHGIIKNRRNKVAESRMFLWTYALLSWPILAMTTANLGISVRQKWMFAPMLIFLLISVLGRPRQYSPEPRPTAVMRIYQTYGIQPGQKRRP